MNHLVISGGEPFIQAESISGLITELKKERDIHVSVETNGTILNDRLIKEVDFFSISPKLKNSVPTLAKLTKTNITIPFEPEQSEKTRKNISAIQAIIDHCKTMPGKDFQLKFVVQNHDELQEIEETFLSQLTGWNPDDVVLMPLGSTPEELVQTRMVTLAAAIERGWRFSPRLQINYFGGIAGV
jgi:7-carboxy-7-deazaguanine synthase